MTETLAPRAVATRAIRPEDLLALETITDARLSPDGRLVAFVVKRSDLERNENLSTIWLVPADGRGPARQLTAGSGRDTAPRWSPDGSRLAFLSDRAGPAQLYLLERDAAGWGGEPRQVTRFSRAVNAPAWSPDGRRLAVTTSEGNGADDAERSQPGGMIRRITRVPYRYDARGYVDGRFEHVWVVDLDGGEPVQVTRGEQDDRAPAWSPDGSRLAFISNRQGPPNEIIFSELWVVDAPAPGAGPRARTDGEGDGARLVSLGLEQVTAAAWSPDGALIAVIGRREQAPGGANTCVYALAPDGSAPARNLSADLDRGVGVGVFSDTWSTLAAPPTLFWSPDGQAVYFTACDEGRVSCYRTGRDGGVERIVGGDRAVAFVSASADGSRLAFAAGSFTNPCDLFSCDPDGTHERRLTELNAAALAELPIQTPERFRFPSDDGGFAVDAWLIRPVGYKVGNPYPLVQLIHGGPHSVFGHTFFFDMQLWASAGYHVLFVNPRASQGYGEAFATCNLGRWGEGDAPEQLRALDLALERGGIDPTRLAVTGLSYGGYLTNWLIGHTDRYRVAVSENGICNLISFYGTSDIGWAWQERELFPDIWNHLDDYMRLSPISYVRNMRTPTLLLQAEGDWRCPIEQGEQLYTALRAKGVPTELIRFPGDSHGFLATGKPRSRLERRRHTLRWWQTYL